MRHGDGDLTTLLETSVPPADLTKVGIFSSPLAKYKLKACDEFCLPASTYCLFAIQPSLGLANSNGQVQEDKFSEAAQCLASKKAMQTS